MHLLVESHFAPRWLADVFFCRHAHWQEAGLLVASRSDWMLLSSVAGKSEQSHVFTIFVHLGLQDLRNVKFHCLCSVQVLGFSDCILYLLDRLGIVFVILVKD